MNYVLPFALFFAFLAYMKWQSSREGMGMQEWADRRNARPITPRRWIPLAVWCGIVVTAFIVSSIGRHGFRWPVLLVVPAFAAISYLMLRLNQRRARRRLDRL